MFVFLYSSIVQANPTDELEERFQQMTLPEPALPDTGNGPYDDILYYYPYIIDYLENSVRSLHYEPHLWFG